MQANGQGNDKGPQYRAGVYYHDEEQVRDRNLVPRRAWKWFSVSFPLIFRDCMNKLSCPDLVLGSPCTIVCLFVFCRHVRGPDGESLQL